MEKKIHLTNEDLAKKFKSNFDLVSYAIKLAENMIRSGRDARVKSDVQNRPMLILEEINEGKDQFDIIEEPKHYSVDSHGVPEVEEVFKTKQFFEEKQERRRAKAALSDEE